MPQRNRAEMTAVALFMPAFLRGYVTCSGRRCPFSQAARPPRPAVQTVPTAHLRPDRNAAPSGLCRCCSVPVPRLLKEGFCRLRRSKCPARDDKGTMTTEVEIDIL